MAAKFSQGDRVWGRHTGWDGVQYIVESVSDVAPDFEITCRSMSSGRTVRFAEAQMVRCLAPKVGAWEREQQRKQG